MKVKRKPLHKTKRKPKPLSAASKRIAILEKALATEREFREGNKQLIKELGVALTLEKTTTSQIDVHRQLIRLRSSDSWKRAATFLVDLFQAGTISRIDIELTYRLSEEFSKAIRNDRI